MPVLVMGHMPELFVNPEEFSPDRWNRENREHVHSFASLPFGTGPRMCVGECTSGSTIYVVAAAND